MPAGAINRRGRKRQLPLLFASTPRYIICSSKAPGRALKFPFVLACLLTGFSARSRLNRADSAIGEDYPISGCQESRPKETDTMPF